MKSIFESVPLLNNENKKHFKIEINGKYALIDYCKFGNQIALVHTETHPELAEKGAASAVVEKTLKYLKANTIPLFPFCPFVFAYIMDHPEWKQIVSPNFKEY